MPGALFFWSDARKVDAGFPSGMRPDTTISELAGGIASRATAASLKPARRGSLTVQVMPAAPPAPARPTRRLPAARRQAACAAPAAALGVTAQPISCAGFGCCVARRQRGGRAAAAHRGAITEPGGASRILVGGIDRSPDRACASRRPSRAYGPPMQHRRTADRLDRDDLRAVRIDRSRAAAAVVIGGALDIDGPAAHRRTDRLESHAAHDLGHALGRHGPIGRHGRGTCTAPMPAHCAATNPAARKRDKPHAITPRARQLVPRTEPSSMNQAELGRGEAQ